jgi:hypothetical protein
LSKVCGNILHILANAVVAVAEYHRGVNVSAVVGSIKRTEYINVVIGAVKLFLCKLAGV